MSATITELQNDWLERVLGIRLQGATADKGKHADALDVTYGELLRVEREVLASTRAAKPSVLLGRFGYVDSALGATQSQLDRFEDDDVRGGRYSKPRTVAKMNEVRGMVDTSRVRLVALSLQELARVAADRTGKTATLQARADTLASEGEAATAEERTQLYKDASETLNETSRDLADWRAQIDEAKVWLAGAAGQFRTQVAALDAAAKALDGIVGACLPPVTSRLPQRNEEPKAKIIDGKTVARLSGEDGAPPSDEQVLQALKACGSTWTAAKAMYGGDKKEMQFLADYRKKRVDEWLTRELGKYGLSVGPGNGWVSVGSTDPTSDYDISINRHGTADGTPPGKPVYDYQMVQEFNDWFRGAFGAEGGTVFDTNLYAAAPSMVENPDPGAVSTGDVAALMKLRRYMTGGEFEAMRHETIAACGEDVAQQLKVEQQFEEADFNYRIALSEIIANGIVKLDARIKARAGKDLPKDQKDLDTEEQKLLLQARDLQDRGKRASGIELADLQTENEAMAREIDHALKDATLETTNEVYAQKKGEVRQQERAILALQGLQQVLKVEPIDRGLLGDALTAAEAVLREMKIDSKSIAAARAALDAGDQGGFEQSLRDVTDTLSGELGERLQQLGRTGALTMFFANEAYQSTGPFAHVVTATQAAEAEGTASVVNDVNNLLTEADKTLAPKVQAVIVAVGGRANYDQLDGDARTQREAEAQTAIDRSVGDLKAERRRAIPDDQCLQSFNEQLGDFLKDLEHYGDEDPGKAIIQSSKYLERLLDAVGLMIGKEMFRADQGLLTALQDECKLQGQIKGQLIAARKGNLMLMPQEGNAPVDQAEQRRAFACQFVREKLGVTSLAGLAQRYTSLAVRINKAARVHLATAGQGS